jgi:putative proteasome-type protease
MRLPASWGLRSPGLGYGSRRAREGRLQVQHPSPARRPGQGREAEPLPHLSPGKPLSATEDSPYLQIGEVKYGRPILDRGIEFGSTSLEVAGTYALLSLDAAMRSNVTVGPPLEVLLYQNDKLDFDRYRRFEADDPELDA